MTAAPLLYRCEPLKAWISEAACKTNAAKAKSKGDEGLGLRDKCPGCPGVRALSKRDGREPRPATDFRSGPVPVERAPGLAVVPSGKVKAAMRVARMKNDPGPRRQAAPPAVIEEETMPKTDRTQAVRKTLAVWDRPNLSGPKVRATLQAMKVNLDEFARRYLEAASKKRTAIREPLPEDIRAVEDFQRTGDFNALRKALGGCGTAKAASTLGRVVAWLRQGGTR